MKPQQGGIGISNLYYNDYIMYVQDIDRYLRADEISERIRRGNLICLNNL